MGREIRNYYTFDWRNDDRANAREESAARAEPTTTSSRLLDIAKPTTSSLTRVFYRRFARHALIAPLVIAKQESNVNTRITLIYRNRLYTDCRRRIIDG